VIPVFGVVEPAPVLGDHAELVVDDGEPLTLLGGFGLRLEHGADLEVGALGVVELVGQVLTVGL
jgi:hypothetical protein